MKTNTKNETNVKRQRFLRDRRLRRSKPCNQNTPSAKPHRPPANSSDNRQPLPGPCAPEYYPLHLDVLTLRALHLDTTF